MKKIALVIAALLLTGASFAGTTTLTKTQRSITKAWKSTSITGVQLDHDANIVYGGEDIESRHELAAGTISA